NRRKHKNIRRCLEPRRLAAPPISKTNNQPDRRTKTMAMANVNRLAAWIALAGTALLGTAGAQELVTQTLDRVAVNSTRTVLEMAFPDPRRSADFVLTGISGAALSSCTLTAVDGLYCLDGTLVRHWAQLSAPDVFDS